MGYIVLGVLALVIVIPAVLIWFRTPEQKGQLPLGATEADIEAAKNAIRKPPPRPRRTCRASRPSKR